MGVPVVTALTAGGVYATVQHHRKHGVNKTLRHSTLQARVNHVKRQARQAAEQAEQREGGKDRPGLAYEWAKHVLARDENGQQIHGRYAFNVGGKGEIPQWLNPCSAPGIGFTGPGAHDALRCCVLTILLRTGRRPAGRVIIPAADATTLLGSAQPDTVPEGLRIVEDLDHALAALENEVTQRRKATREQLEQLPLVVLVLAETPATRDRAEDLADLLHAARWLGVSALIGATWTEGASLDIDERSVVTGTRGHPVNHLHNAYLFHLPARHLRNAYPDIDNANAAADYRHGPTSGGLNTPDPETTSAETTATEVTGTEAGAEGAAATTTEPTVADPNELDPDHHPDGGPAAEPDRESEAPTTGTAGAAAASPEGTGSSVARILKPPDGPKAGAADREQIPTTTQASEHHATTTDDAPLAHAAKAAQDDKDAARVAVAAEASRPVVRLEILNTPRMTVMPAATSDDPDPTPINVTPGARARTQTQVWINMALNREGRRRAVIAAELFPDTPIDRPATNTLNTNMTRLRQLIQDKTGGAVADLVHITEEGTCRLADVVEVDYWEFQDAMAPHNGMSTPERARAFQHALRGYRGQLAESVDADWITSYRDEMQSTVLKAAVDLAHDLSENHGDHDTAIAILDQAITWDPLAESIYQHVIGLLMNLSREDAAIQRYRALEIELDREFDGMKPQPETTRLIWP